MAILGRQRGRGSARDIPDRHKYVSSTFNTIRKHAAYTYMNEVITNPTSRQSREISNKVSSIAPTKFKSLAVSARQRYTHKDTYDQSMLDLGNSMVKDALALSRGTLEDYKKESNTMTKKNEVEKINDTEKEELVTFITNMRQSGESFWWMGIYTGPNDRPKVISTSMRGFFKDMFWRPLETERQSCCDEIEGSITNGVSAFILTQHCASQDHVRNLINSRTEEELYAEYQYMLNETLDALVDGFGDD